MVNNLCSDFSQNIHESPIGSAANFDAYLLISVPMPWKSEITESEKFPTNIKDLLNQNPNILKNTKILGFKPEKNEDSSKINIILYKNPKGSFKKFYKFEFLANHMNLEELIIDLLNSNYENHRFLINHNKNYRDLLICTHGSRDSCCASKGYPFYEKILHLEQSNNLMAYQVSHIGGHRFAPNIIDMPDGRNWVKINQDSIETFINKKNPVSVFRENYRGWTILKNGFEQVAEKEAFTIENWEWVNKKIISITSFETKNSNDSKLVKIVYSNENNSVKNQINVEVAKTKKIPVLKCTKNEFTEYSQQYKVINITKNH
ncbi:MAG: hypothetical protein FI687_00410 [SAR202 cluster bacterium]|nr:hypothetical protein [SAR202 cluster bacterium]|tara:strand:- start:12425 stop:13378 length:954 start_codon:yes stop_codon:yes gene_type:complete